MTWFRVYLVEHNESLGVEVEEFIESHGRLCPRGLRNGGFGRWRCGCAWVWVWVCMSVYVLCPRGFRYGGFSGVSVCVCGCVRARVFVVCMDGYTQKHAHI